MEKLEFEVDPIDHPFANDNPLEIMRIGEVFVCLLRNSDGIIHAHCVPVSEEFDYTAAHLTVQITNVNTKFLKKILPMISNAYQKNVKIKGVNRVVYMLDGG